MNSKYEQTPVRKIAPWIILVSVGALHTIILLSGTDLC